MAFSNGKYLPESFSYLPSLFRTHISTQLYKKIWINQLFLNKLLLPSVYASAFISKQPHKTKTWHQNSDKPNKRLSTETSTPYTTYGNIRIRKISQGFVKGTLRPEWHNSFLNIAKLNSLNSGSKSLFISEMWVVLNIVPKTKLIYII